VDILSKGLLYFPTRINITQVAVKQHFN